jgi:hypothetical protein
VADGLLAAPLAYDGLGQQLMVQTKRRRRSVTGVVPALNGYQDGRCAYCNEQMRDSGGAVVEHVLPWMLLTRAWPGPDLDAVWNLVLACRACDGAKHGRAPHETWIPWLEQRNNDLIASHHPLRETLLSQTGPTVEARRTMLRRVYQLATERLPKVWPPHATQVREAWSAAAELPK